MMVYFVETSVTGVSPAPGIAELIFIVAGEPDTARYCARASPDHTASPTSKAARRSARAAVAGAVMTSASAGDGEGHDTRCGAHDARRCRCIELVGQRQTRRVELGDAGDDVDGGRGQRGQPGARGAGRRGKVGGERDTRRHRRRDAGGDRGTRLV